MDLKIKESIFTPLHIAGENPGTSGHSSCTTNVDQLESITVVGLALVSNSLCPRFTVTTD